MKLNKYIIALVFLFVPLASFATSYDPGFPDQLFCEQDFGQDTEIVLDYDMIDHDGFYYGRNDARVYSWGGGTAYVRFNSDKTYYDSYGVHSSCKYNIDQLATSTRAVFFSERSTSTATSTTGLSSEITIVDDPTRNLFYGLILFFIMLFGLLFYLKRKGGD